MARIHSGQTVNETLQAGKSITVTSVSVATVYVRRKRAGVSVETILTAAQSQTFGPFNLDAQYSITSIGGATDYVEQDGLVDLSASGAVIDVPTLAAQIDSTTGTLTGKTIDGGSNTLTNIPAAQLVGSLQIDSLAGLLTVPNGGIGVGTITGLVKGNGTDPMSAAAVSDVAAMFTGGSALSTYYLAADGTKQLNSAGAADSSLAYTWTNLHTWSLAEPRLLLNESDRGTDLKLWDIDLNAGVLSIRTRTDLDGAGQNALSVTRGTTTALTNITVGYSVAGSYTFPFTGTATFSGAVSVDRLVLTGTTSVANGFSVPTGNTPTAYSNSTARFQWTSSGITLLSGNFVAGTIGQGLQIKEGTNAKMGVATLVAGTVVVSNTAVTANSRIFLTAQSLGTVSVPSALCISARTAGTSFTILASVNTDTSVVAWQIVEPAP